MGGWSGDKQFGIGRDTPGPDGPRSTTLHEMQHAIQNLEGHARGGNPSMYANELMAQGRSEFDANEIAARWGLAYYNRLAGEVEARAVQKRMDYTPEQRRSQPPWLDYDVREGNQIVRNRLMGEP